jgi:hypothetical protein
MVKIVSTPDNAKTATVDFYKPEINGVLWKKGLDVIHERGIQCPCKSKSSGATTTCKNCLGNGWLWINPEQTRMIVMSMNRDTKFKEWSVESIGRVGITSLSEAEISFMDRITIESAESTFGQVLFNLSELTNNKITFAATYPLISISYIALFRGVNNKLLPLEKDNDYTISDNWIFLDSKFLESGVPVSEQTLSITVRYKHKPQFYIIDLTRDILVSTDTYGKTIEEVKFPLHAIGKRAHYIIDGKDISQTNLLSNTQPSY